MFHERKLGVAAQSGIHHREPVRVLLVIPTLAGGGAERVFVTLARLLDRERFRVSMAVFDLSSEQYRAEIPEDVQIIDLKSRKVRFGLAAAVRVIRREAPDLVVSTLNHLNTSIALTRPLWPPGVRFVARPTLFPSAELTTHPYPRVWSKLSRLAARWTDLFILQSSQMEEDLLRLAGVPKIKARIIANPLDFARVRALAGERRAARDRRPEGHRIVAAGRFDEQKGFDLLLDAVALLVNTLPVSLTILGEGPLRATLEDRIESLGLKGEVSMPGHVANPYAVFAQSDLFVLSSRYEGFPNVVIEALACGAPVVATPLPGLTSFLENIPGCRVASEISAPALAAEIAAALMQSPPEISDGSLVEFGFRSLRAYEQAFLDALAQESESAQNKRHSTRS